MFQSKGDKAIACFKEGFNCSQAVFSTYCEELGLDLETGLKVSCPLGGGMGRLQGTCGAVSGAYLLLGLKYGKYLKEDNPARDKTYAMVREFAKLFEERNGTTTCRDLLGLDFNDTDPKESAQQIQSTCPKLVRDAIEIFEELVFSDE